MNTKRWMLVAAVIGALHFSTAYGQARGQATRTEHDLLGEKEVPADAYYGVQTARALENFQISGVAINHYPELRRGVGHRQARRGARQHRGRRDEAGAPRGDREGLPGRAWTASTTISSWSIGTRAAPAPRPT